MPAPGYAWLSFIVEEQGSKLLAGGQLLGNTIRDCNLYRLPTLLGIEFLGLTCPEASGPWGKFAI